VGDRPSHYLDFGQLAIKAALVLGSPYTAMLFMGEEWASSSPFQFFTSHPEPELAMATAEGRKAEFAEHGWDADEIPDPQDPETFRRSKLNWDEVGVGDHARLLELYRALIALRHDEPDMANPWLDDMGIDYDEVQRWIVLRRGAFAVACNLGDEPVTVPASGEVIVASFTPSVGETTLLQGHSFAILKSVN
jgi:maltooligosyltrehalose trehalohydrolase